MIRFPLDIQSPTDAPPGPAVSDSGTGPGDVLNGPDGERIVVATAGGGGDRAVDLFDPSTDRRYQSILGDRWHRRERCLGVETALDATDDRQWLAVATSVSPGDSYRCRWGSAPVGATAVTVDDGVVEAPTPATLADELADPAPPSTVSADTWERVSASLRAQIDARSDGVSATRATSLRRTGVSIPTGSSPPLSVAGDRMVAPGDRVVVTPGSAPLDASREDLAAGRCVVALDDGTLYDVVDGTRREASASRVRSLFDPAGDGVVCSLLARDSYVDPVGTTRTYSLHAYRLERGTTAEYLLASETLAGDTPAVEHPFAMHCHCVADPARLRERLAAVETLAGIEDPTSGLRERCRAMATRLRRGGPS